MKPSSAMHWMITSAVKLSNKKEGAVKNYSSFFAFKAVYWMIFPYSLLFAVRTIFTDPFYGWTQ